MNIKNSRILFSACILCIFLIGCNHQLDENNRTNTKCVYEIEEVFPNDTFMSIIEGETVPVEIKLGIGGESGYEQFSTKDPEMIAEYIDVFRTVKVEQVITDEDKMVFVFDGIEDYCFIMEDETEIVLGTDLSMYVIDRERGKEFVLEYNEKLRSLNNRIRGNSSGENHLN